MAHTYDIYDIYICVYVLQATMEIGRKCNSMPFMHMNTPQALYTKAVCPSNY